MSLVKLPCGHPHRPHESLIHAILAAASDVSPHSTVQRQGKSGGRGEYVSKEQQDRFILSLCTPSSRPNMQQPQGPEQMSFKEFHLSKARQKVERSLMTDFQNPLDWLGACVICCFVLWHEFRIVESFFLSGFICRAVPVSVDRCPGRLFQEIVQ